MYGRLALMNIIAKLSNTPMSNPTSIDIIITLKNVPSLKILNQKC